MGLEKQIAKIGRLEELTTEAKESLVGAINEVAAGGGGGGGGGVMVVNFTYDEDTNSIISDHTVEEVETALETGMVIGYFDTVTYIAMYLDGVSSADGIAVGACFMRAAWDSEKSAYTLTPKFGIDKTDRTKWKDFIY